MTGSPVFYTYYWERGSLGVSDDEDETAELQRELEKIKRERAEKREQEVRLRILEC